MTTTTYSPLVSVPGSPLTAESAETPAAFAAPVAHNGGTNSAGSAPVLTAPGFTSGTASQLSDLTRDYEVYFTIGTGGGTVTIAIGPTSTPATTLVNGAVGVAGEVIRVRLPAGWYLEITVATSTIARQIAVGC